MAKQTNTIKVDFTGVEAGGGSRLLPEGVYQFEVIDIEKKRSDNSGADYLAFELEVTEGDHKGTKAWDNFSLQPQSLWKLRGFMEAAGLETTDGPMNINLDDMVGLIISAEVFHEEYKGKTKHRIGSYLSDDDSSSSQVEDPPARAAKEEEPPAETRRPKKKVAKPADDDDDGDGFTVGAKASFKDGRKTLSGKITEVNGDVITVKVGDDEFEMGRDDITLE